MRRKLNAQPNQEGMLELHDDALRVRPFDARRKIWCALTGQDRDVDFGDELTFPEHGVLAYHGHLSDGVNYDPDGAGTFGDALGRDYEWWTGSMIPQR